MNIDHESYHCDYKQHVRQHLYDLMDELKKSQLKKQSTLERLVDAHWEYVESVLIAHGEEDEVIKKCEHHYRTAFIHGWKHAEEARKQSGELY